MRVVAFLTVVCLTVAWTVPLAAAPKGRAGVVGSMANSQFENEPGDDRRPSLRPMTREEMQSVGCLSAGTALTGLGYALGPADLMAVLGGGAVAGSPPAVIGLAVFATVFASGCAIGAIGTPGAIWVIDQSNALYTHAIEALFYPLAAVPTGTPPEENPIVDGGAQ